MDRINNVLVRLPNWLGDQVMSTAFVSQLALNFPGANIDLITRRGLEFLLDYFPAHNKRFVFDKQENKGALGAWRFGKEIGTQENYDLFFSLPDSVSSALMGRASKAKQRVGFAKQMRSMLLTHAYSKPKNLHRVEEYLALLEKYINSTLPATGVLLRKKSVEQHNAMVININSEASSRRLPIQKAVSIINKIYDDFQLPIILIGAPKDEAMVSEVYESLCCKNHVQNLAGKTSMPELIGILGAAKVLLSTDSGPAHVANALGTPTLVLFGAGNEQNTAPYNAQGRLTMRLGQLSCEPCLSNTCKRFGIPECLNRLDENIISKNLLSLLGKKS